MLYNCEEYTNVSEIEDIIEILKINKVAGLEGI